MPLPFGNRERGPRQLFSSETSQARTATLHNALQLIDDALQHGQFPGMSFDNQPAAKPPEAEPVYSMPTEVAAGATALQEVQAPAPVAEIATVVTSFENPEQLVMSHMVEMTHEFTQAA